MTPKEPLASDEWKHNGARKRKDTKRWCKGKVGKEHVPVVELSRRFMSRANDGRDECSRKWLGCIHHEVCEACGKELKMRVDECPTTGWKRKKR